MIFGIKSGTARHLILALLNRHESGLSVDLIFSKIRETLRHTKKLSVDTDFIPNLELNECIVNHQGKWFITAVGKATLTKLDEVTITTTAGPPSVDKFRGTYQGLELKPFQGRPGAMDAYAIKSKFNRS